MVSGTMDPHGPNRNPNQSMDSGNANPYEMRQELLRRIEHIDRQLAGEVTNAQQARQGTPADYDAPKGLKGTGMPPTDSESVRPNFMQEIETSMRVSNEVVDALVVEVHRLRGILAIERQERFEDQQRVLKTLDGLRTHAGSVFQTAEGEPMSMPGSPKRW